MIDITDATLQKALLTSPKTETEVAGRSLHIFNRPKKSTKLDRRELRLMKGFVLIFMTVWQMKTRKNSDCFEIQYL
ncbi:hypothetical protein NPIL_156481 [Nephila pilipes]|uniref:Uncharacterized protein n=1 Tax=Nephila pilipes TaxID=299642 RepID=A0A8X6U502_NEPPI|nr:hypothetical protein NPIL_156481 [Nephila pilipes]